MNITYEHVFPTCVRKHDIDLIEVVTNVLVLKCVLLNEIFIGVNQLSLSLSLMKTVQVYGYELITK